jgi:hypothetical protein
MDVNRLSQGARIAAISGIVLFIVMFLNWFGIDIDGVQDLSEENLRDAEEAFRGEGDADADSFSISAWESFSFIDILLFAAVVVSVGLAALRATGNDLDLPIPAGTLVAGAGALAVLLILFRLLDTPYGFDREIGVFLGLIAAAGITYGGYLMMQEEGTAVPGTTPGAAP